MWGNSGAELVIFAAQYPKVRPTGSRTRAGMAVCKIERPVAGRRTTLGSCRPRQNLGLPVRLITPSLEAQLATRHVDYALTKMRYRVLLGSSIKSLHDTTIESPSHKIFCT